MPDKSPWTSRSARGRLFVVVGAGRLQSRYPVSRAGGSAQARWLYNVLVAMESDISSVLLDDRDGLNPARALILQAYYALRRAVAPERIGCGEILAWIKGHEPNEPVPSEALIRLTLSRHGLAHRAPGRPRNDSRVTAPPFLRADRCPSRESGR